MAEDYGVRRRRLNDRPSENMPQRTGIPQPIHCRKLVARAVLCVAFLFVGFLTYAYITSPVSSVVINGIHDVTKMTWPTVINSDLQGGEKVLDELKGPVSVAVDTNENWYTGLEDGRLVKITNAGRPSQEITDITKITEYSAGRLRTIRRPHGMRIHKDRLYFTDCYQGLFVLDIHNFKWEVLVGYKDVKPELEFTNDLTLTKDGLTIYFTDSSMRWGYDKFVYSHLEGECTGRVLKYHLLTKKLEILRDKLCFPSGIQITPDERFLLLSESGMGRILVMDAKSGSTVKIVLIPCGAGNIRLSKSGGYWVSIPALHNANSDFLFPYPFLRDIMGKILGVDGLTSAANFKQGIVVKLNDDFDPTSIHYDLDGHVCQAITEVQEYEKGKFLLGSFMAHGIAKLNHIGA